MSALPITVIVLWQGVPGVCPRCGPACCSAEENEPGEFMCAGRCDSAGHHDETVGDVYNAEPCWHACP